MCGTMSCNWQWCCADRRAAEESELQKPEEVNQHGMLGPTPLHCPGSCVAPSPGQLPSSWNNGSPGDNVISCLEAAPRDLLPWHCQSCCSFQANGHFHMGLVEVWSLLAR